ncbi:MAG: DUF262 domain-containing protein [Aureispira sp.]
MSSKLKIETRVRLLPAYIADFGQGKMQIPSFQRDFVWDKEQIRLLFDSIKNNYPIGSIQFWEPLEQKKAWIIKDASIGPYKRITKDDNIERPRYILDGLQRLSCLFGCLTNPKQYDKTLFKLDQTIFNKIFALFYDLEKEEFIHLGHRQTNKAYQIPLYVLFDSVAYRQYSRKYLYQLEDEEKINLYLERADTLAHTLINYQIASIELTNATADEAVQIFKRVNSTGRDISPDWIMSALTSKGDFRLSDEIDELLKYLSIYNFGKIKREVVFQSIRNAFGKFYYDTTIETLAKRKDVIEVVRSVIKAVKQTVKFLHDELLVANASLLPYNPQIIFLSQFFYRIGLEFMTKEQEIALKKWFWYTTYSNYFTVYSSIGKLRAVYYQMNAFIDGTINDPIYYDTKNKLMVQSFPDKVSKRGVRSKALLLFMLNHALDQDGLTIKGKGGKIIDEFKVGRLFEEAKSTAENFIPVYRLKAQDFKELRPISPTFKKQKDYVRDLEDTKEHPNLFISAEMQEIWKNNPNEEGQEQILELRKQWIQEAEQKFVDKIGGLNYGSLETETLS